MRVIALISVSAVIVTRIRRGVGLGTGEHVVAVGVFAVEQAEHLLFNVAQLIGNRGAIRITDHATACLQCQLVGFLHGVVDAGQH